MFYAFVFPFDIVKTSQFWIQSRKISQSSLQKPLAHRLRYGLVGGQRERIGTGVVHLVCLVDLVYLVSFVQL